MPNGLNPIIVAIADDTLRGAVENALVASAGVHPIPAATTPVTVMSENLGPSRAALFRVLPGGTLEIAVDPGQTTMPQLDFLHELGHYVDWAVLDPPSQMSSSALSAEFDDWLRAVAASDACLEMLRIATRPGVFEVTLDDGTEVQLLEDATHAAYALSAPEVFARSYCQYIAARSRDPLLAEELRRALRSHYPEQWSPEDFEPIAQAIEGLLGGAL